MGIDFFPSIHAREESRVRRWNDAKINDTYGFGFQIGYNLNAHWNLAGVFSWSQPDYQATVQPAAGNPSPARSVSGTLQTNTFAFAATYHFLTGHLTECRL